MLYVSDMAKRSNPVIRSKPSLSEAERKGRGLVVSPSKNELPEPMDPLHRAAVEEARAQFRRGEMATDEDIEAAFRRFEP